MAWPKGVTKKQIKQKDKKSEKAADPAPELLEETAPEPIKATAKGSDDYACKSCKHPEKIHYDGRDLQCNTEGCRCLRYVR